MNSAATKNTLGQAEHICDLDDLIVNSGVCALWQGKQVAIFYLPDLSPSIFAVSNWDPIGKAEVISRGIVGDVDGIPIVASPLYKQHFDLRTGRCLEDENHRLDCYQIKLQEKEVWLTP